MHKQLFTIPQAAEEGDVNSHPLQKSFHIMSCGMWYPFGQFKTAILILLPLSSLSPALWMALALYNIY